MTSPLQVTMNDLPTVKEGAPFTPLRFAIVHILPACRLHYQHLDHHRHQHSYFNRLEIRQNFYTTGFLGQKLYTVKQHTLRRFLLKRNGVNALISVILVDFLLEFD